MTDDPIAFIDSGVGGLPYLQWAASRLPLETFIYIADNKNFPYGEKDAEELKEIIIELIRNVVERFHPKIIIIACNTASIVALSSLRRIFGIHFIGVVPAIKPAARKSRNKIIGLLATKKTVEDPYTDALIEEYASSCSVKKFASADIVRFVEDHFFSSTEFEKENAVKEATDYFKNNGIDALVLGCTHFLHLKDYFMKFLGPGVDVIDSRDGVGRQIIKTIETEHIGSDKKMEDMFYITGSNFDSSIYMSFAEHFGLTYGGKL